MTKAQAGTLGVEEKSEKDITTNYSLRQEFVLVLEPLPTACNIESVQMFT